MLRLSEHYVSVQGEGPRTGTLTQFVRFAGCNMRCPGWPCDTQYAIVPELYINDSTKKMPHALAEDIHNLAMETGAMNICFTGGEPFLQKDDKLAALVHTLGGLETTEPFTYEWFTNGSFEIPPWTRRYDTIFMMDWKLAGSGEAKTHREVRTHNALNKLQEGDGIKFVVKDMDDLNEAVALTVVLENQGCKAQYWVGKVWDGELTDQEIVDFMISMGMPWKLNVQVHKYIWPAAERGV